MSTNIKYGESTESHIKRGSDPENEKLTLIESEIRKVGDKVRNLHTEMML